MFDRQDALYHKERKATLSPSVKEILVLLCVLDFIGQIATQSASTNSTVLAAGVLDLLLRVYVVFPTLSEVEADDANQKFVLLDACRSIMNALFPSPQIDAIIPDHPVFILWTSCYAQSPGYSGEVMGGTSLDRGFAWSQANKFVSKRRMSSIYKGSLWKSDIHDMGDMETCIDIVEFTQ